MSALCFCGCGMPAPIAKRNRPELGHVKGQPIKFRQGHGGRRPIADRFWAKVDRGSPTDCWLWTAGTLRGGYGAFSPESGRQASAHRVAYELTHGSIPDGLVLDHLCRTPACVNPAHLEPVTHRENTLRGTAPTAVNARKTHCANGHEFTPDNTYVTRNGGRNCRACHRDYERQARSAS